MASCHHASGPGASSPAHRVGVSRAATRKVRANRTIAKQAPGNHRPRGTRSHRIVSHTFPGRQPLPCGTELMTRTAQGHRKFSPFKLDRH